MTMVLIGIAAAAAIGAAYRAARRRRLDAERLDERLRRLLL